MTVARSRLLQRFPLRRRPALRSRFPTPSQAGGTHVKINGQSGRSCTETRIVTYADGTTHKDVFESYYPMIPKTIEVGPTTTTTTVRPTTTTTQPGTGTTVVTEF